MLGIGIEIGIDIGIAIGIGVDIAIETPLIDLVWQTDWVFHLTPPKIRIYSSPAGATI